MNDHKHPFKGENSLVISVHRENSTDNKNWYSVEDWTANPIESKRIPKEIKKAFTTLVKEGTVGAVARGQDKHHNTPILLYLINISAAEAIPMKAGGQGETIHDFTTSLANQTILFCGPAEGSADLSYYQLTQDEWGKYPYPPSAWNELGAIGIVDDLIKDSTLAIDVVKSPPNTSITCYVLNLASFTDPPPQPR